MPDLTDDQRREIAAAVMLDRARDIDSLDIAEHATDHLDITDADINAITDLIAQADITVTFPQEPNHA